MFHYSILSNMVPSFPNNAIISSQLNFILHLRPSTKCSSKPLRELLVMKTYQCVFYLSLRPSPTLPFSAPARGFSRGTFLTFRTHTALQVSGTGRRQNRNASHPPTTTSSLPPPALCHSHQSLHFSALTLSSIRPCQWSQVRSY